jgi:tripartite-type tricarboxylate transporter receptor subunit TctC
MRLIALIAFALAATGAPQPGLGQPYPSGPVRMVLPYAPGGMTDVLARVLAQKMSESLGQPIVMENIPGAGSTVGTAAVARAAPNGYTLLFAYSSGLTIGPGLYANPGYNPLTSFAPIGSVARFFFYLAANSSVPANDLKELIAYARQNPGKLALGTPGIGSTPHLLGEILNTSQGLKIVHVPYKGGGPLMVDLLAGRVDLSWDGISNLKGGIHAAKLKPLAVTSASRQAEFPNVATVIEAGLPDLAVFNWTALLAPAGMPRDVTARLEAALTEALKTTEVQQTYSSRGLEMFPGSPERVLEMMRAELPRWAAAIKASGAKAE